MIEARNGGEGLASFARAAINLVVTDIVMPEREGLEALMTLRKSEPPVAIIAISGGGWRSPARDYLRIAKAMGTAAVLNPSPTRRYSRPSRPC